MTNIQKPAINGKSPYVKYQKRPFIYSDDLNNWTAAIKKGDKAAADRHDKAWRNKFAAGIRPYEHTHVEFNYMEEELR